MIGPCTVPLLFALSVLANHMSSLPNILVCPCRPFWPMCKTPWEERLAFGQWTSTPGSERKDAKMNLPTCSDDRGAEEAAAKLKHTHLLCKTRQANQSLSWHATRAFLVTGLQGDVAGGP